MNNARKECPLDSLELELLPAMSNIPGKSCISLLFLFTNSRHKLKTTQSFQTRYWTGAARLNTFIAVTAMLHYHLLQHTLHTPHMGLELDHAAKIAASAESSLAWERSRVCMICNGLPKLPYVRHFWHGERLRDL